MCIRDRPKSKLGVDIENHYIPKYITIRGKGELISKLRKAAKKADKVYLATDPEDVYKRQVLVRAFLCHALLIC